MRRGGWGGGERGPRILLLFAPCGRSAPSGNLGGQARRVTFLFRDSEQLAWICSPPTPTKPRHAPSRQCNTEENRSQVKDWNERPFPFVSGLHKRFKAEVAESNVLQVGLQELLGACLWGRPYPFSALEPPCCQHLSLSGPGLSLAIGSLSP